ncbi:putative bifunctional diguanylate cyclase/phosphodiesterase [Novosphingobium cyanobacteriorum]|uniref:EAL domain-containing protein n=1 Tax=Novosphingobium cyanobacteriorum TaxID=3024215 RepID=A0ABT6CHD8_9SPHN|nr:EAL domain-containing protein [Novosphingobium cyanobacteriorum]MDF8332703.1 EAL domain-containing protein [Novosphingobium cyanobacteriorum]
MDGNPIITTSRVRHLRLRGWLRRTVQGLSSGAGRAWTQRRGDDFTRAYVDSLSQRMPLLYLVVVFDLALLVARFRESAPPVLLAGGLGLACYAFARALYWLPHRVAKRAIERQRADLDSMALKAAISGIAFVGWTLALYGHGNADQRGLSQFVLAVTMFTGILGVGHAPRTSLALALVYSLPATAFFVWIGDPGAAYLALIQLGVSTILLFIVHGHHRDFVRLELSRQQLARRERQAAKLAAAHFRQATVDALTGGLNRRGILVRLEHALAETGARVRPWLALADLDGFKHVNDTYGHAAGDAVLRAVSTRIAESRGVLAHGRLGGDEFAILFDSAFDARAVLAACRRLSDAIRQPIGHHGATLRLCASIGVHRLGQESASACLERADAALYKAKAMGDGAVCLFGMEDERLLQQRIATTRRFNDCLLEDRLRLLYQPIFDQSEGRTVGFEALARWSPDGINWQSPASFLSMADATGRSGELTRLVLARALQECRPTSKGLLLAINLSPRDLMREGTVEALAAVVEAEGESSTAIILEVTERALLVDPVRAAAQLQRFRDAGFRLALDDFGAGWSGLSHLRDLPLDYVKLDRALAAALPDDPGARAVAGMIVALAWQLGIVCTAEGVETVSQAEAARALGIHLMQGYHFGYPEPAAIALAISDNAAA